MYIWLRIAQKKTPFVHAHTLRIPFVHFSHTISKNKRACLGRLDHLRLRWRRQLGAEDAVPEAAGDAETVLVVGEVVLQVILLEFAPVGWETGRVVSFEVLCNSEVLFLWDEFDLPLVVQEIVGAVVADVAENAAAIDCDRGVPVVEEDGVGEFPEGRGED